VAVPFLYAGLNFLSAPSATSLDTLWDGHAREQERDYYRAMKERANIAMVGKAQISGRPASNSTSGTRERSKTSAEKGLDRSSQIEKE